MQALSRSYPEEKYQNFDKKRFQFMSDTKPCLVINATSEDNLKLYQERDNKVTSYMHVLLIQAKIPCMHAWSIRMCMDAAILHESFLIVDIGF